MVSTLRKRTFPVLLTGIALASAAPSMAQPSRGENSSLSSMPQELAEKGRAALTRGAAYLIGNQSTDGSWRNFAAITALCGVALHNCPPSQNDLGRLIAVEKARQRLLASAQPDGAICPPNRMYANYSTSVCLAALSILGKPEDAEIIDKARQYLLDQQFGSDRSGQPVDEDSADYGGFGYGGAKSGGAPAAQRGNRPQDSNGRPSKRVRKDRADLSCTQWALEALFLSHSLEHTAKGRQDQDTKDMNLAWQRARVFLQKVQNLQETGDGTWLVSDDSDGGFRYLPSAEGDDLASYGSMTYAGLKSMIYAQLKRDDPRVTAALDWAAKRYTVDENPGKGANGHYYYLLTMAKALAAYGTEELTTTDGNSHRWRTDIVQKLIALQAIDGQWQNELSGRWQESDPQLVTAYAMITLEIALVSH